MIDNLSIESKIDSCLKDLKQKGHQFNRRSLAFIGDLIYHISGGLEGYTVSEEEIVEKSPDVLLKVYGYLWESVLDSVQIHSYVDIAIILEALIEHDLAEAVTKRKEKLPVLERKHPLVETTWNKSKTVLKELTDKKLDEQVRRKRSGSTKDYV